MLQLVAEKHARRLAYLSVLLPVGLFSALQLMSNRLGDSFWLGYHPIIPNSTIFVIFVLLVLIVSLTFAIIAVFLVRRFKVTSIRIPAYLGLGLNVVLALPWVFAIISFVFHRPEFMDHPNNFVGRWQGTLQFVDGVLECQMELNEDGSAQMKMVGANQVTYPGVWGVSGASFWIRLDAAVDTDDTAPGLMRWGIGTIWPDDLGFNVDGHSLFFRRVK